MLNPNDMVLAGDQDVTREVRREQLRLVLQQQPLALVTTLAVMCIAAWLLGDSVPPVLLGAWFGSVLALVIMRALMYWRFHRRDSDLPPDRLDSVMLQIGVAATGAACGAAPLLGQYGAGIETQAVVLLLLGGVAAGGLGSLSPFLRAYLLFLVPLLGPGVAWLMLRPDPASRIMGTVTILLAAVLAAAAFAHARKLGEVLTLKVENSSLNRNLFRASAEMMRNSQELDEEIDQRRRAETDLATYSEELQRANIALQKEIDERRRNEDALTQQARNVVESEVRMRAVFQNAFDGILAFTPDGVVQAANPAAESLFRVDPLELKGRNIGDLAPDLRIATLQPKQVLELTGHRSDGTTFPCSMVQEELKVGTESLYVAIFHDNTDTKVAREALAEARTAADAADRAKSEFLSGMSQALRTPMNTILGFAQLLQSDPEHPLHPEQQESVDQIATAGWHLLELTNDVLDLAKVEAGKLEPVLEEVRLGDVLGECVNLIGPVAQEHAVRLTDLSAGNGVTVRADFTRLKQVILNLLSNAIRYNQQGGHVTLESPEVGEGYCRITVADSGRGLTPEQIERVFEPFTRLGDDQDEIAGSGIGLTVARRFATMMGGEIGVESTPGSGSRFWVDVPLVAVAQAQDSPTPVANQAVATPTQAAPATNADYTLLYVDGNAASFTLVDTVIQQRRPGIRLLGADTGESGILLAASERPDLLMCDIALPGMSGYEVLTILREQPETRDIPVFAVGADTTPEALDRAIAAGFSHYLCKPIDVPQLLKTIDSQLERSAA